MDGFLWVQGNQLGYLVLHFLLQQLPLLLFLLNFQIFKGIFNKFEDSLSSPFLCSNEYVNTGSVVAIYEVNLSLELSQINLLSGTVVDIGHFFSFDWILSLYLFVDDKSQQLIDVFRCQHLMCLFTEYLELIPLQPIVDPLNGLMLIYQIFQNTYVLGFSKFDTFVNDDFAEQKHEELFVELPFLLRLAFLGHFVQK